MLGNYLVDEEIDIDKVIDDFYNYVYTVVKNSVSVAITDEDIEEIISDVFVALWKNSKKLSKETALKPYLIGISKNIIKNKYRKTKLNFSITNYEENIESSVDISQIIESLEKDSIVQKELKQLSKDEYLAFIMFYYEAKSIKEIAKVLKCSKGNIKVILHRVRKKLKEKLEDGGYGYGK